MGCIMGMRDYMSRSPHPGNFDEEQVCVICLSKAGTLDSREKLVVRDELLSYGTSSQTYNFLFLPCSSFGYDLLQYSTTNHQIAETIVDHQIYSLYNPESHGLQTEIDIVFFHGLQLGDYRNAYIDTWVSDVPAARGQPHRRICWPGKWLGKEDFPRARILTISYDSRAFGGGGESLRDIVRAILIRLITNADVGQNRPVILVGHSLGGLVIKKMCVEANCQSDASRSVVGIPSRAREFLRNTLGALFYATPHGGAPLARVVKWLKIFRRAGPVLQDLASDHLELTQLTEDFDQYRQKWNWKTSGLGEVLPIPGTGCFRIVVVPAASSRRDLVDDYIAVNTAHHFSICKPESKTHQSYVWIKSFVQGLIQTELRADIDQPYRAVRGLSYPTKVFEALTYIQNIPEKNKEIARQYLEAGVMLSLIKLLESDSTEMKTEATWALDNLVHNPELREVKLEAGEAGAIDLLVRNMLNNKKTVYPGIYCLRVLTDEVENRRKLRRCGSKATIILEGLENHSTASNYVDPSDWASLIEIENAAREVLECMHDVA